MLFLRGTLGNHGLLRWDLRGHALLRRFWSLILLRRAFGSCIFLWRNFFYQIFLRRSGTLEHLFLFRFGLRWQLLVRWVWARSHGRLLLWHFLINIRFLVRRSGLWSLDKWLCLLILAKWLNFWRSWWLYHLGCRIHCCLRFVSGTTNITLKFFWAFPLWTNRDCRSGHGWFTIDRITKSFLSFGWIGRLQCHLNILS